MGHVDSMSDIEKGERDEMIEEDRQMKGRMRTGEKDGYKNLGEGKKGQIRKRAEFSYKTQTNLSFLTAL